MSTKRGEVLTFSGGSVGLVVPILVGKERPYRVGDDVPYQGGVWRIRKIAVARGIIMRLVIEKITETTVESQP